jgi:hypothetical protein
VSLSLSGTIYLRQERIELAEYHFKRAIAINPSSSVLQTYLGMVLNAYDRCVCVSVCVSVCVCVCVVCVCVCDAVLFVASKHLPATTLLLYY